MKKKFLSILLVFCIIFSIVSAIKISAYDTDNCEHKWNNITGGCDDCGVSNVKVLYNSLTLEGDIGVNFYVHVIDASKIEEFEFFDESGNIIEQIPIDKCETEKIDNIDCYKLTCRVAAKEMADKIILKYKVKEKTIKPDETQQNLIRVIAYVTDRVDPNKLTVTIDTSGPVDPDKITIETSDPVDPNKLTVTIETSDPVDPNKLTVTIETSDPVDPNKLTITTETDDPNNQIKAENKVQEMLNKIKEVLLQLNKGRVNKVTAGKGSSGQPINGLLNEASEGENLIELQKYSVRDYALKVLEDNGRIDDQNDKLKNLCAAMLNFGAAAQNQFSYNLENLANASYEGAEVPNDLDDDNISFADYEYKEEGSEAGITFEGSTLVLETETKLNLWFKAEDGKWPNGIIIKDKDGNEISGDRVEVKDRDGYKVVSIKGIIAKELGSDVTVQIGNLKVTGCSFSYANSVYKHYGEGEGQTLKTVMQELYDYYVAARDYFIV